jgi:hypothetical protein
MLFFPWVLHSTHAWWMHAPKFVSLLSLSLSLSSFPKKKFKKILTKTFTTKHLSFFVWGSPHISLYHFCYRYKKPSKTNKTPKGARKLLQGWPNPPSSSGEESFFLSVTFVFYFFYKVSNLCDMEIFYRLLWDER